MKLCLLSVAVLAALAGTRAEHVRFDNYKVYRVLPKTDEHIDILRKLEDKLNLDFWKEVTGKNVPAFAMVSPSNDEQFNYILRSFNIESEVYIENVQTKIDENSVSSRSTGDYDWNNYYDLDKIYAWLDQLAAKYSAVKTIVIGKSYEKRDIKGVKVSFKEGNKAVFIEGTIHAREWISSTTATYILNQILSNTDPAVREVVESYDWYIFPVTNPDGFAYTHNGNRLWRKTMQPFGYCSGADPNRNWGFHWMDGGSSDNPCSELYAGPKAFSEPETKVLSEFLTSISKELVAYLDFHSFSQFMLIPYGYTDDHLDNYNELMEIGTKAAKTLENRHGTKYIVGSITEVIYVASGSSMDWVKGNFQTPITFAFELRDTGRHGFLLPTDQIVPTGEETFDSVLTIMQEAKARGHV